jgi:glucose-1-phosphate adenylyltransferase
VEGAIVDKNARIGKGARIVNVENKTLADGENFVIRDGIVVIPKNVVVPDGSVI